MEAHRSCCSLSKPTAASKEPPSKTRRISGSKVTRDGFTEKNITSAAACGLAYRLLLGAEDERSQFACQEYRPGYTDKIGWTGQPPCGLPSLGGVGASRVRHVRATREKASEFFRRDAARVVAVARKEGVLEMRRQDTKDAGHVFVVAAGKNEQSPRGGE